MSFFSKIFGRKPAGVAAAAPGAEKGNTPPDDLVKVYDAYGRELMIPKQEWLDKVLLGNLENARDDPQQLHGLLITALNDGFAKHVVKYAERLHENDPDAARSTIVLGVVYMECGRLDDAERVFKKHLRKDSENGYVLVNLAKVYSRRGETAQADDTLWRALEVEPNQENGLLWYYAIAKERGGEKAGVEAFQRIAALPKSWLARLWLARFALDEKKNDKAFSLYAEAINLAPRPLPAELLMQLTGDLGNHGLLIEALRLAMPHFDPQFHGVLVGNNLIKANVDLGRLDHARTLVDQIYGLKRPDFQETLAFWDAEIAKARSAANAELLPERPQVSIMTIEGPLWLRKSSPAAELLPSKTEDAVVLGLMSGSADTGERGAPRVQMSNEVGRLARGLTLFLTEQFHFRTEGIGITMQPMVVGGAGGFVLAGACWSDEDCADYARQCTPAGDYVLLTHFNATHKPYEVFARLIRTIDGSLLASRTAPLNPMQPGPCFLALADWLDNSMANHTQCAPIDPPAAYQLPSSDLLSHYFLRLEQALAVVAANSDASPEFLNGEREIVGGNLQLCLSESKNVTTRLLLVSTLHNLKKVRPQVVEEFRDKVELLQKEHPLDEPFNRTVERILADVYAT